MFHQSRRLFFDWLFESKKNLVETPGFFCLRSIGHRGRTMCAAVDEAMSGPSTRLERPNRLCVRMSEQKYQSIVIEEFWKGWSSRCSRKFAVSCRRLPTSR